MYGNKNTSNSVPITNFGPPIVGGFRDANGMTQFGAPIGGSFTNANGTSQFGAPGVGSNYMWTQPHQ